MTHPKHTYEEICRIDDELRQAQKNLKEGDFERHITTYGLAKLCFDQAAPDAVSLLRQYREALERIAEGKWDAHGYQTDIATEALATDTEKEAI